MNCEEYFAKEFKAYIDYKAHILAGANLGQDTRVGKIVGSLTDAARQMREADMLKQREALLGYDLGCQPNSNGIVSPTEFIKRALPDTLDILSETEAVEYCLIKGITAPYFEELNKSVVILQPRISYSKRITGNDGQFIKDASGEVMKRDIDIPKGSRVVLSHKSIHLKNYTTNESGRREYTNLPEGFGYIDYIEKQYRYYIPRMYLHPLGSDSNALESGAQCQVTDIPVQYFDKLNNSIVTVASKASNTEIVPDDSLAVLSTVAICPSNLSADEFRRRVRPPRGFDYIGVDEAKYLYYVPREYIYRMNLNALVFTQSRLTARYYWGRQYIFNRGLSSAYLYIAPYTNSILKPDNVVFCLKADTNFDQEIASLEKYWQPPSGENPASAKQTILYPFEMTQLQSTMGTAIDGDNNLSYHTLPIPDRPPYEPIGESLALTDADEPIIL